MVREISVIHIHHGCMRRYYVWDFSDWLSALENGLRNGHFHGGHDDEWV